ncbi:MAG: CinA family nicotinamide mononucleotide deamidase-related protein [Planctomycetia bacterium]|nr:CinA family nicotinamide mononucleotide deamidase-related protein [Planctomycetia bacterium]
MRAEVISIGDELTSGQRLDTNCQWLSLRLAELGVETAFHTTVADDEAANIDVFRNALDRADIVVSTGGLGPTADDLTREVLAKSVGKGLVLDEAALRHVEGLFARRGRPMPERNKIQAYFPEGSRVVPNPQGTAPGIDIDVPRTGRNPCRAFALPGVPAEMKEMWQATVEPAIRAMLPEARVIRHRRIKCFGVGESDLEQMLPDLIRRGRVPSVGITVHEATITLRITASGRDEAECREAMEPTARTIYECLGELVFGEEDDELQHAVVRLLKQRDLTLAITEWGTGGVLARWLAEAGAEGYFSGSTLVTSDMTAIKWLETSPDVRAAETLAQDDACLSRTTALLAEAARSRFGADIGLAAGRAPAILADAPTPPKICFALADRNGTVVKPMPFAGHSAILVPRAAKQALNLLRLELSKPK